MKHKDFEKVRKEYEDSGIDPTQLTEDPIQLFRQWYQTAVENQPEEWLEPNAMSLATCDAAGTVTNRYLLMKGIVDDGIQFFTNYESRKGKQMESNPRAAAAFHWPFLGRQVRIEGRVVKTDRSVSEEYFHSRPRAAQINAATSKQSQPVESREFLDQVSQEFDRAYQGQVIPLPDCWGGYRLVADRIEFWQGRPDRLHDRIVYQLESGNWQRVRLSP